MENKTGNYKYTKSLHHEKVRRKETEKFSIQHINSDNDDNNSQQLHSEYNVPGKVLSIVDTKIIWSRDAGRLVLRACSFDR